MPSSRGRGDSWASAWTINSRGYVNAALGDLGAAETDADEPTRRFRALGDERAAHWGIALSALVAHHRGDEPRARDLARRVRTFTERCGDLRTAR